MIVSDGGGFWLKKVVVLVLSLNEEVCFKFGSSHLWFYKALDLLLNCFIKVDSMRFCISGALDRDCHHILLVIAMKA